MRDAPEIRYAKSGGLSIAYQAVGTGPPEVLFIPGFISNVELMWGMPFIARILERLSSMGRLIVFDKRGTGLSDRTLGSGTAEDRMDDVRAVADAAGATQPAVIGLSEGGPLAVLYATTYPERVSALVLWGTFARTYPAPDYEIGTDRDLVGGLLESVEAQWGTGRALRSFVQHLPDDDDTIRSTARYERQAATPGVALEILRANCEIDVRSALSAVSVPTLVVHRTGDRLVDVPKGRYLAEHIAGARLAELPGDWHVNGRPGGDDDALDQMEEFLTGRPVAPASSDVDRVLATVLFTDIVDSTARAAALGDRAWTELLERHDELAAKAIESHRGTLVKRTGDGLLATFDGPGRCVRAAEAVRDGADSIGLTIRAGAHTGEIERRDDDVAGIAVHLAARIAALAGPGELLVSSTVKDLVYGSGIEFASRGTHQLKGLPHEWPLFVVEA